MPKQSDVIPEEPVYAFFDFYAMYELYLRVGGYRDIGYEKYDTFVCERAYNLIKEKYEEVVDTFFRRIYDALEESVAAEIRHFPRRCSHCIALNEFYPQLREKSGFSNDHFDEAKKHPEKHPEVVWAMFYYPLWSCCYGGKKWAAAAKLLVESRNLKTRHDKVGWCDRVLDLYHNTGHLLNKTEFSCLSDSCVLTKKGKWSKPLNYRAHAKSIMAYVHFMTPSVKRLVIPQARLLSV